MLMVIFSALRACCVEAPLMAFDKNDARIHTGQNSCSNPAGFVRHKFDAVRYGLLKNTRYASKCCLILRQQQRQPAASVDNN